MAFTLLFRRYLVTGLLLLAIGTSHALTLGRTRGVVLIGQPLNVEVLLTLSTGETTSALCLEADVFHADTLVATSKVSVATVAAGAGQAVLRIRSQAVVDEPFVMLFVRAGCTEKVTRRYVLLADVAGDAGAAGVTITPVVVPATVGPSIAPALATPAAVNLTPTTPNSTATAPRAQLVSPRKTPPPKKAVPEAVYNKAAVPANATPVAQAPAAAQT